MDLEDIVKIAVDKQSELTSAALAARQADKVEGLEVSEEGEIESIDGDHDQILQDLIDNFEEMMGDVAANLIAQEMKKKDVEKSELPEELSERF